MFRTEGPGLIRVTGTAALHCGLWAKAKARKTQTCKLTRNPIPVGFECYRPITNTAARTQRVMAHVMEKHAAHDDELFARR